MLRKHYCIHLVPVDAQQSTECKTKSFSCIPSPPGQPCYFQAALYFVS